MTPKIPTHDVHSQMCLCMSNKGFPDGSVSKESPCNAGDVGPTPWVARQPTPEFLPGKSCGQGSLADYSP